MVNSTQNIIATLTEFFSSRLIQTLTLGIIALIVSLVILWIINSQMKKLAERNIISTMASEKIRKIANLIIVIILVLVELYIATNYNVVLIIVVIAIAIVMGASWKVLSMIIAHYTLILSRHISQGELIEVGGLRGRVKNIGLVHTTLRTEDDNIILIPNSKLIEDSVKHLGNERTLILRLKLNITNPNDIENIEESLDTIITERFKHARKTGEHELLIEKVDESSVTYLVKTKYLGVEERESVSNVLIKALLEGLGEYQPMIEIVKLG